ncbi:MAG: CAP domain-containing protein [Actinomycetota bacterium]
MNRITRTCAGLLAVALFATLAPTSLATAAGRRNCWRYRHRERAFARRIDVARGTRGLAPLKLDKHLSKVARRHTRDMKNRNYLHHTPSRALRRRVTRWVVLGENVGMGATVDSLHRAFMGSAGHRANVLHRAYRYVGVGATRGHGRLWVTVIFESARNPGTRLPMPPC